MDADRERDLERLDRLIRETLPGLEAHGHNCGPFRYRYASGREGDAYRASMASRKTGTSCVRFKRLGDVDEGELRDLLAEAGRLPAPGAP